MAVGMYGPEVVLNGGVPAPLALASRSITVKTTAGGAATLYTDATGSTSTGTNVVVTDSRGQLSFFAAPGFYDLQFTDSVGSQTLRVEVPVNTESAAATYRAVYPVASPSGDSTGATDSAAIQAAINTAATAYAASGVLGVVALAGGLYLTNTGLKMKSGVILQGAGMLATTVKLASGATADSGIQNNSWASSAPATWTVTESNYGVCDLTVDCNKTVVTNFTYGITFKACSGVRLERVRVINTKTGSGIFVWGGDDVAVRNCTLGTGVDGNGIFLADVTNAVVANNYVKNVGDYGIEIGAGYDYTGTGQAAIIGGVTVTGNRVVGSTNFGICARGIKDATANPSNRPLRDVTISGNSVSGNGYGLGIQELADGIVMSGNSVRANTTGILITQGAGAQAYGQRSTVSGNTVIDSVQYGISTVAAQNVTFSGNTVVYNGRDGLVGSLAYCSITGNIIRNNGTAAASTYDNVSTTATSTDVEIRGNDLADRNGRTARYDLNGNSQTLIVAVGNATALTNAVTTGASDAGVATQQTTTSTSYTDLATTGPAVTATIGASGKALVTLSAALQNNTSGQYSIAAVAVSGATTVAAADAKGLYVSEATTALEYRMSTTYLATGLTPGQNTFTMKYKVTGGTGTYSNRNVVVVPLD